MSDPYRDPAIIETDDAKVVRLRREYDMIAISAMSTPEANMRARDRMREIDRSCVPLGVGHEPMHDARRVPVRAVPRAIYRRGQR